MTNADIIRAAHQAFDAGNYDQFMALCSDEPTFHWPGNNPLAGHHVGRDAFRRVIDMEVEVLEQEGAGWEGDYLTVLESGDCCVTVENGRGWRPDGRKIDVRILILAELRDGKITALWEHPYDLYAWDAFWA